jgi:hypothetical protein
MGSGGGTQRGNNRKASEMEFKCAHLLHLACLSLLRRPPLVHPFQAAFLVPRRRRAYYTQAFIMSGISFEAYNQRKINRWALHRLVGKFQESNTPLAKRHEQDLKYTALTLYNEMIDALRKGKLRTISLIRIVVDTSKIIEETTLTEEKIGSLETYYKDYLYKFYFEEGDNYRHTYRLPNKVDSFERFGKKTDRVKDIALTIVMEMYSEDQINRKEVMEEVNKAKELTFNTLEEIEKAYDEDLINREEYLRRCRELFRPRIEASKHSG